MSGWRALLVTSHRILVSEWLRTVLPIMPPKRKNYWKTYRRNERAAFEKKHGMSECQEALEVWEDKERWDAKNLNYYARLCRYWERKGFL